MRGRRTCQDWGQQKWDDAAEELTRLQPADGGGAEKDVEHVTDLMRRLLFGLEAKHKTKVDKNQCEFWAQNIFRFRTTTAPSR